RFTVGHFLSVYRDDDIPLLAPGARRSASGFDCAHQRSAGARQLEARRQIRSHTLHCDTELPPLDAPVRLQLSHDLTSHVRRDGETQPDVAARWRQNLRVDADQLTIEVDQCTTRVALVDGRIGLKKV